LESYYLPDHIDKVIDLIGGVHGFPKMDSTYFHTIGATNDVTPKVIYETYSVPMGLMSKNSSNRQAVAEFQDEFFSPTDLQQFFKEYSPNLVGQEVKQVVGFNDPKIPGVEPNLDVQYIMATGPGVNMTVYNINSPKSIYTDFLEWIWDVGNDTSPPWVHSVSYGAYGGTYPTGPVHRLDNEYMKLGLRGVSIFFASGDNGVGCSLTCKKFEPDFPSSPYVTMVGSTKLSGNKEVGADFSAGGFSNTWTMPTWQQTVVENYLNGSPLPPSTFYNASGRAYPDLSAFGENVQVVVNGKVIPVGGTSCSSPMVAGLVTMLNDIRLVKGKPTLGFFNPLLYSWSSVPFAFQDVLTGNNRKGCCPGFDARAGWDPVTGLGTPNFTTWSNLVQNLK